MIVLKFNRSFTNDEFKEVMELLEALSYYGDLNVTVGETEYDSDMEV